MISAAAASPGPLPPWRWPPAHSCCCPGTWSGLRGRLIAAYRGVMKQLILVLLAVLAAFLLLGLVVAALRVLFWVALVGLISVGAWRMAIGTRR